MTPAGMKLDDARRFASSLPETHEQAHFEKTSFTIGGRIFATVPPGGHHLHVFVDEHDVRACVADDPSAFEELWWGKRLAGVRVDLRVADRDTVFRAPRGGLATEGTETADLSRSSVTVLQQLASQPDVSADPRREERSGTGGGRSPCARGRRSSIDRRPIHTSARKIDRMSGAGDRLRHPGRSATAMTIRTEGST